MTESFKQKTEKIDPGALRKDRDSFLSDLHKPVHDDANNNPDIPLNPNKLGIDEFLVDRLSLKPSAKYKFRKSLASGGMKMVLEVRDMDTMRDVAMAVLPDADKRPPVDILRFVQEARLTASLEHPNIVPVHDIGIDSNGSPYFTMKLLRGRTLAALLQALQEGDPDAVRDYPLDHLLRIFLMICSGVAFAHSKGVLHLDLKPENIQLGDFGEVLIMDWGLAKMIGNTSFTEKYSVETTEEHHRASPAMTLDGMMKGTPGYMAPEQAAGQNTAKDQRTDIYALGAILYAILTLQSPIPIKPVEEMVNDTLAGAIIPPRLRVPEREIPGALDAVVMKAMSYYPADRYEDVSEIRREVNAFLGGFATMAERASSARKLLLLLKRHIILTVSLFVLMVLLGGMAIYAVREQKLRSSAWLPLCDLHWQGARKPFKNPGIRFRKADMSISDGKNWRSMQNGLLLPQGEWLWLDLPLKSDWRLDLEHLVGNAGDCFEIRIQADINAPGADGRPAGYILRLGMDGGTRDIFYRQEPGKNPECLVSHISGIAPGVVQSTILRREDGKLILEMYHGLQNGKAVSLIDFLPPLTEKDTHIGIRLISGRVRLQKLRLTNRGAAEQTTPLVAADALMDVHLYDAALKKYLQIVNNYGDASFCNDALLKSYQIAALFATGSPHREDDMYKIKKLILQRKDFPYMHRVREVDAAYLWMSGYITAAFRLVDQILKMEPGNDILARLITLKRPDFTKIQQEKFYSLLHRSDFSSLDLSNLGLVSLRALSEMNLVYLDCSGNRITDYSPLLRMPLMVLVTDDGIFAGRHAVRRYLLNKVHKKTAHTTKIGLPDKEEYPRSLIKPTIPAR